MFSTHSRPLLLALQLTTLLGITSATFNASAKTNVVVYYGQGPKQVDILHYCQQATIDTIVLSFINIFPAQGNGFPGSNFGDQCGTDVYKGPGYKGVVDHSKDSLHSYCPRLAPQLVTCQTQYKKKILLGIGGAAEKYQLTGASDGTEFANLLWGMFGPKTAEWTKAGKPRPLDAKNGNFSVDGFTLDIERVSTDNSTGYIALGNRLRGLFPTDKTKTYLLTASPRCAVGDRNMAALIKAVKFDLLFIQFYNIAACAASTWVTGHSKAINSTTSNSSTTSSSLASSALSAPQYGFTFDSWSDWLSKSASKAAKIYIGLPGARQAATAGGYVDAVNARALVENYFCRERLGGVAIWEATYAQANVVSGQTFYASIKGALGSASLNKKLQVCAK